MVSKLILELVNLVVPMSSVQPKARMEKVGVRRCVTIRFDHTVFVNKVGT